MNATPLLGRILDALHEHRLESVPPIHGIRSFEGLRSRAIPQEIAGRTILVASLDDIIASKKAAGRRSDLAVLPVLEQTRKSAARGRPRK
jgi:hypothetical protein